MSQQASHRFAIGAPHRRVLLALATYHHLTAEQVQTLKLGYADYYSTMKVLRGLVKAGYLFKDELPSKASGNSKGVWSLAGKGKSWLAAQDVDVLPRDHHGGRHWELFYEHVLTVNDWLIGLELFCRDNPDFALVSLQHDLVLQRTIPNIPKEGGGFFKVVPDAWGEVWHGEEQLPLWLELDLSGNERMEKWKDKVRGIVAFIEGGHYERLFGTRAVTVAVPVMKGEYRCEQLLTWTEQVLTGLGKTRWGSTFRFSSENFRHYQPADYFTVRHWRSPFARTWEGLL